MILNWNIQLAELVGKFQTIGKHIGLDHLPSASEN